LGEESSVVEDMVLLLLSLFSWREKVAPDQYVARSWKGYDFSILDSLTQKGYISGSRGAKSVIITDEGLEKASKLKEKILTAMDKEGVT
jgi:hypothetical protein